MLIFQHSIPRFNKNFLLYGGFGVKRRPKDMVTLQIILVFTLTHPKTFAQGHVSVFDKYLHWPRVSGKKYIYTLQQDKCNCENFGDVK